MMTKNKGYTLVEFIIVIAIMAVLAGVSFITIGIIKQAKCESAVTTFNNQVGSLMIRTKATSNATNGVDKRLCLVIKKRADGAYVLVSGYTNGSSVTADIAGSAIDFDDDNKCEAVMPKDLVNIVYTPQGTKLDNTDAGAQQFANDYMLIQFLKADSSTVYGGGTYEFYKKAPGGSRLYATIYVDPVSGNHYVK